MDQKEFRTPHGRTVRLWCRPGTNDRDMAYSALDEDEYGLRDVPRGSLHLAADVGAHIGMVAIGLAVDHPGLDVLAVEPIPANIELLRRNIDENGVADRVTIIPGAASKTRTQVDIAWDFAGGETANVHRYVGNQPMPAGTTQSVLSVAGITLVDLIPAGTLDLLVMDCEGGEYALLGAPATAKQRVRQIRGEYHGGYGKLLALLDKTHVVERIAGNDAVGGFIATARA